jgi:hypothetical protein
MPENVMNTKQAYCLFRTKESDYWVGQLTSNRFEENKLTIIFSKMVRIIEGQSNRWVAVDKVIENRPVEFDECVISFQNESTTEYSSSFDDFITITEEPFIAKLIEKLLNEGVAEPDDEKKTSYP